MKLNRKNLDLIMQQCRKMSVDTIRDEKVAHAPRLVLYQLRYKGNPGAEEHPKD